MAAPASTTKPSWRATTLAVATAALLGTVSLDAGALALGRVTVQSALGEPLRAEIDIAEITPEELASLKANVAAPDAFRAAGLEYSPALSNVQVVLQHRANGRPFLLLTSPRPVNDPFIDLILETRWASGRIVRDYTMLFDPPQTRQAAAAPASPLPPVAQPGARAAAPSAAPAAAARPAPATPAARAPVTASAPAPTPAAASARPAEAQAEQVTVQRGDSAGKIAAVHKPPTVSLDQMLVALLQANPEAFVGGNVNRLRAGAVLQVPTAEQASQVSAAEASRTIVAQSRDFNEFRRRLAEGLQAAPVAPSERQASGKVQAEVQDKTAAAPTPDKLTLSKGAMQGKTAEDRIATERQAQDAATRLAELDKNIAELNKLQSSTATSAAAVKPAASGPAAGTAAPQIPVATTTSAAASAAGAAASAPAAASAASASAPAAAASASLAAAPASAARPDAAASTPAKPATVAKKPTPLPVEEPSLLDDLLENPLMLAAGGVALAGLLGLGAYRLRQRKKSPQVDSSFLESRLQPDSFFGGSGGQRIDTAEGGATGSSMVYSASQLDAAGDVDPVAEADVYLAYGRDLQAEEILKEALRITPQRVAIHAKLLEIYSKRRDAKAFEVTATEAYSLTRGEGVEWEHICDLGRELDPSNPLYKPGGTPSAFAGVGGTAGAAAALNALDAPATTSPDLDLDLDFSSGEEGTPAGPQSTAVHLHAAPEPAQGMDLEFEAAQADAAAEARAASEGPDTAAEPDSEAPLAFELPPIDELQAAQAPAIAPLPMRAAAPEAAAEDQGLTFDLDAAPAATAETPVAAAPVVGAANDKMIEFDLDSLSLDLDSSAAPATVEGSPATASDDVLSTQGLEEDASTDPLATKFALAQEFNAIGDPDGARSLAEEVLAEASGELKNRARKFLAEIG